MASHTSASELSKLTVPQLKALCKERKLTGYSKLGKNALLQRLADPSAASCAEPLRTLQTRTPSKRTPQPLREASSTPTTALTNRGSRSDRGGHVNNGTDEQRLRPVPHLQARNSGLDNDATTQEKALKTNKDAKAASRTDARIAVLTVETRTLSDISPSVQNASVPYSFANGIATKTTFEGRQSLILSAHSLQTSETASICAPPISRAFNPMPPPSQTPPSRSTATKSLKRAPDLPSEGSSAKKMKTTHSVLSAGRSPSLESPVSLSSHNSSRTPQLQGQTHHLRLPDTTIIPPIVQEKPNSSSRALPNTASTPIPSGPGKRFKPLVINKKLPVSTPAKSEYSALQTSKPTVVSSSSAALYYLDSPSTSSAPSLAPIAFPPSILQRKRVLQWAVILSGLDDGDRRQCIFVSKMFRYAGVSLRLPELLTAYVGSQLKLVPLFYAVYLSAGHILQRDFRGKRLDTILQSYPQAMTNLWPYLKLRRTEAVTKRRAYTQSFLPRALEGRPAPIAERLWGNPDDEKQIVITLRFVMTRAWFALSIGGEGSDDWLRETVVDAQEIVPGEIWSVKLQTSHHDPSRGCQAESRTLYVLEATCEVVGQPPALSHTAAAIRSVEAKSRILLRADWSAYINKHLGADQPPSAFVSASILTHLKWSNHEEYDRGISKLWSRRITAEGEIGAAKRTVALRYVLACVVGNSVSGTWKTATEMAQDFAGLPGRQMAPASVRVDGPVREPPVNLYLPAHHHVESVHFATSCNQPLHPALAVVQTPGREYFILKDNGMQVGCEEDGVAPLWMEILRCDATGLQLKRTSES